VVKKYFVLCNQLGKWSAALYQVRPQNGDVNLMTAQTYFLTTKKKNFVGRQTVYLL